MLFFWSMSKRLGACTLLYGMVTDGQKMPYRTPLVVASELSGNGDWILLRTDQADTSNLFTTHRNKKFPLQFQPDDLSHPEPPNNKTLALIPGSICPLLQESIRPGSLFILRPNSTSHSTALLS